MGIFGDLAAKYREQGYSPIPVIGKAPVVKDWSKWGRVAPTDAEFDQLLRDFHNCNIGIACGPASGGLVFVDNDADTSKYPLVDHILRSELPPTPVERIGAKGYALAYRIKDDGHFAPVKGPDGTLFELLRVGRQTVIPPSVHPDTKRPYVWVGDDLLDYTPSDLPEITIEMLHACAERVRDAYPGVKNGAGITGTFKSPDGVRSPHGSQQRLKDLCIAKIYDGKPETQVIDEIYQFDQMNHDGVPYFGEYGRVSDAPTKNARLNASIFYGKILASMVRVSGDPVPTPGDTRDIPEDRIYPSKKNGFFIQSKTKNGEPTGRAEPDFNGYSKYFIDKFKPISVPGSMGGITSVYNGKHYEELPYLKFCNGVRLATNSRASAAHMKEFYARMQADSVGMLGHPPQGFLNMSNGVLNLRDRKTWPLEHSHTYKFKYVLDHLNYEPDAKCPQWLRFLDEILGDAELIKTIQLYTAYTLAGGKPWLHQAICLIGTGRNGKSALIEVIKQLLGTPNYSATPTSELGERFKRMSIFGKLANFDEEAKSMESSLFKVITSGGDITAERKNQDAFHFPCETRLWDVYNAMPIFRDRTRSVLDRLIMVPFNRYIPENQRDPYLVSKLCIELPGILNWALDAMNEVIGMGAIPMPAASKDLMKEYLMDSDTVRAFFDERITFTTNPYDVVLSRVLYAHYRTWCDMNGYGALNNSHFGRQVQSIIDERVREFNAEHPTEKDYKDRDARGVYYLRMKISV